MGQSVRAQTSHFWDFYSVDTPALFVAIRADDKQGQHPPFQTSFIATRFSATRIN